MELIRSPLMRVMIAQQLRLWQLAEAKERRKQSMKRWQGAHPENAKERQARYNKTPKAAIRGRRYRDRHPDKVAVWHLARKESGRAALSDKRYAERHPEKVKAMARSYATRNAAKIKETSRRYRENNPEKMRAIWSANQKRRYAENPQFRMIKHCRSRLQSAFKMQGVKMPASTSKLIGCTWSELKRHIESQFLPGMTWENRGTWHVDHIRPLAKFDLSDPAQVARACNWENLQPLWAGDNIRKGAKFTEPITA